MDNPPKKTALRDNALAISAYLSEALAENDLKNAQAALSQVMRAQNVKAMAREAGLRRDNLYTHFGGKVDPRLGRILKMFQALNVRFVVTPLGPREKPERPKLGRPPKDRDGNN